MSGPHNLPTWNVFEDLGHYITTAVGVAGFAVDRGYASPDDRRIAELQRHLDRAAALAAHLRDHPEET